MNKSKDELAKKENELSLAKQDEMEKKQEKTKLLEKIKSEEDDLKKKLEMAQKKLRLVRLVQCLKPLLKETPPNLI